MNQDIENIIKKKVAEEILKPDIDNPTPLTTEEISYNLGLEKISHSASLIADEVLKVVVKNLSSEVEKFVKGENFWDEQQKKKDFWKGALNARNKMKDFVLQLLSNLSPNKENKNNERNTKNYI